MNRERLTTIAHQDHLICNPIGEERADRILALMELEPGERVLDVGCGKGELLIRLVERFGVAGVGVDPNREFLQEAERRGRERTRRAFIRPVTGSEKDFHAEPGDLLLLEGRIASVRLAPGSFAAAICIGSTHAFGSSRDALHGLAAFVRPGGHILLGEGYWKCDPDPGYLEALGARREEFTDHEENVRAGEAVGLVPLYSVTSSEEEWDHYEGLYLRAVERHADAHPEDPESSEMKAHIRRWRDTYLRWGRRTLGFGMYLYLKPR